MGHSTQRPLAREPWESFPLSSSSAVSPLLPLLSNSRWSPSLPPPLQRPRAWNAGSADASRLDSLGSPVLGWAAAPASAGWRLSYSRASVQGLPEISEWSVSLALNNEWKENRISCTANTSSQINLLLSNIPGFIFRCSRQWRSGSMFCYFSYQAALASSTSFHLISLMKSHNWANLPPRQLLFFSFSLPAFVSRSALCAAIGLEKMLLQVLPIPSLTLENEIFSCHLYTLQF